MFLILLVNWTTGKHPRRIYKPNCLIIIMEMEVNKQLAELVGIIIGDGNIYYNPSVRKYYFEITGNKLEKDYFSYISDLVFQILKKRPSISIRGRGLRLRLYSKEFVEYLIYNLNMPYGAQKGKRVKIPDIFNNWNLIKYCIKGITDTDGSLFLSKKGNNLKYPCIEIVTTSKPLAYQLKKLLQNKIRIGFRKFSRFPFRDKYTVSINGKDRVNEWINEIGFSNPRKINGNGGTFISPQK